MDAFIDPDSGNLPDIETLRTLCQNHGAADFKAPNIRAYAARYGYEVDFTPPYWPQQQPVEKIWSNLKWDWYNYQCVDRKQFGDLRNYIMKFFGTITDKELLGWVRHTDKFCRAILTKDSSVLKAHVLAVI